MLRVLPHSCCSYCFEHEKDDFRNVAALQRKAATEAHINGDAL